MIFTILKTKARPITMKSYQCYVDVCIISYHIISLILCIISYHWYHCYIEVRCIVYLFFLNNQRCFLLKPVEDETFQFNVLIWRFSYVPVLDHGWCSVIVLIFYTVWKVFKYGPEITPHLNTFHAVLIL